MDRRDFLKFCGGALAALGLHKVPVVEAEPESSEAEKVFGTNSELTDVPAPGLPGNVWVKQIQSDTIQASIPPYPWKAMASTDICCGDTVYALFDGSVAPIFCMPATYECPWIGIANESAAQGEMVTLSALIFSDEEYANSRWGGFDFRSG